MVLANARRGGIIATTVKVSRLPQCDLCTKVAYADAKTLRGQWAYVCERHFRTEGCQLGLGKGQALILERGHDGRS